MPEGTPSSVRLEGVTAFGEGPNRLSRAAARREHDDGTRRSPSRRAPFWTFARRSGTVPWEGRPAMAVTTGFQGRTGDVREPRTGVPRIDHPDAVADAVFADAKVFLSSSETRRMSESELERELHRRGQELVRKLLQEHHDQRSPGETAGPAEDANGVECSELCVHESHTETTSRTMQVVRSGCARCHGLHPLDALLNLLPASRAPPRTPWKPQWYSHHPRGSGVAGGGARHRLLKGPVGIPSATGGPQGATGSRRLDAY